MEVADTSWNLGSDQETGSRDKPDTQGRNKAIDDVFRMLKSVMPVYASTVVL